MFPPCSSQDLNASKSQAVPTLSCPFHSTSCFKGPGGLSAVYLPCSRLFHFHFLSSKEAALVLKPVASLRGPAHARAGTQQQVTEQHTALFSFLLNTGSLNAACASRGKQKICQAKLICGLDKLNSISVRILHRMYRCLQTWKEFYFLSQAMGAKFRCESEFSSSGGSLSWCILHLLPPPLIPGVHYAGLASLIFSFHLCALRCTQAHIHQPQFKSPAFCLNPEPRHPRLYLRNLRKS